MKIRDSGFNQEEMNSKLERRRQSRIIILTVIGLALLGVLVVIFDWKEAHRIVGQADWQKALPALLFCALSYFCLSYSFALVNQLFGIRRGLFYLFNIGYVSTVINSILGFLGAAGHSLRLMLMRQPGTTTSQIFAASIFHSYLNNLMMSYFLTGGLIYLLVSHSLGRAATTGVILFLGVLVILFVFATAMFFARSIRAAILQALGRTWHFLVRRNISNFLNSFDNSLALGGTAIRNRPLTLALSFGMLALNWGLALVVLWFCFDALGTSLSPGALLAGFAIGITAGNVSMVPGGLGVQEASMAGIYTLLGVSFEQAVLASILFRIVYDFIPFFVSLVFYRQLLRVSAPPGIPADSDRYES